MLSPQIVNQLSQDWIQSWNENSLDKHILMYVDDAEEVSSISSRLIDFTHGRIKGKHTLAIYWTLLKQAFPKMQYSLKRTIHADKHILVYFQIPIWESEAIAKLELNEQFKITKALISHV